MPIAIQMFERGTADVLRAVDLPSQPLKAGELRVRHSVIGFNYLDVYLRTGVYEVPLPSVLGVEATGVVTEVGAGVDGFQIGDRIAYSYELGAYATERTLDATRAIHLPDDIADETAASLLFKGQTAHMLLRRVYPVQAGDTILVHSAAGGVGMIAARWAKALGATVIGTVGSAAKRAAALGNGADHVAVLGRDDVAALARDVTGGVGVAAVYDAVGRDTIEASLRSLRPFGVIASYGLASGEFDPIAPRALSRYGSPFFIRPAIDHYISDVNVHRQSAADVFDLIRRGVLTPQIGQRFALTDVADAHRQAEARQTTGATLLIP